MGDLQMPLIAVAAIYLYAASIFPLLKRFSRQGHALIYCFAAAPLAGPLLVLSDQVVARALLAFPCLDLALKIIDFAREVRRRRDTSYAEYLRFLVPIPLLLVRLRERTRLKQWPAWEEIPRAVVTGVIVAATFWLLGPVGQIEAVRQYFALDHAVKLLMFVVLIEVGSHLLQSVERLLGYDTTLLVRGSFLSLTPAEFWSRYNTRIHSWLEANVYRPCGGRTRGIAAVFFVSAVLHELMFDIATSHPDGYQFAFFMLQAPAVIVSPALKRFADRYGTTGRLLVKGLTVAWFYFTSMLFFRGVERIFPFLYVSQPWLP